jgi:hypothetical protein
MFTRTMYATNLNFQTWLVAFTINARSCPCVSTLKLPATEMNAYK